MWRALEEVSPYEEVEAAAALLGELLPADNETESEVRRQLAGRYNTVRPLLSLLSESSALDVVKRLPTLSWCKGKAKPLLVRDRPEASATRLYLALTKAG